MYGNERGIQNGAASRTAAPFWTTQMRKSEELLQCVGVMGVGIQSRSAVSVIGKQQIHTKE